MPTADERRLLELLAAADDGSTEALLLEGWRERR